MSLIRRILNLQEPAAEAEEPEPFVAEGAERASPGIAALFAGLEANGQHTLLDLGAADENNLALFGRYARRIRFADLIAHPPRGDPFREALRALAPPPPGAFDLVMAWNLLDFLGPEERKDLVDRLVQLTTPQARIYVLVDGSEQRLAHPLHLSVLELDRVRQKALGPTLPMGPLLLPAEVERLIAPFEVVHAFTLRGGLREYVGFREKGAFLGPSWRDRPRAKDPGSPGRRLPR